VKTNLEPPDHSQCERQKIEKEGSLSLGGKGNHLAFAVGAGLFVNVNKVGGLAPEAGTVIDDLAVDFSRGIINK
jgi:hypothetical protein